jgi:hypothetical protein
MPDHDQTITTLEQYRILAADARAALREVVEQHAPPGSLPSEMMEPPFVKEAEVLVTAILAIAAKRTADIPGSRQHHQLYSAGPT